MRLLKAKCGDLLRKVSSRLSNKYRLLCCCGSLQDHSEGSRAALLTDSMSHNDSLGGFFLVINTKLTLPVQINEARFKGVMILCSHNEGFEATK